MKMIAACQSYKGTWVCDETYIGETIRWIELEEIRKESERDKRLRDNLNHIFKWETFLQAFKNYGRRKNLESSFGTIIEPVLKNQLDTKKVYLFRNGVTW